MITIGVFNIDYKISTVTIKVVDHFEDRVISYLSSQMKQELISRARDNIKGWQRIWGKRIEETAIGRIRYELSEKALTFVAVDRFLPTTKECLHCHQVQEIDLSERVYVCENYGLKIVRNLNSAIVEKYYGLKELGILTTVHRKFTPLEIEPSTLAFVKYMNSIPYVRAIWSMN